MKLGRKGRAVTRSPSESEIRKKSYEFLLLSGVRCSTINYQPTQRTRRGAYQASVGVADITGCFRGRHFEIELKTTAGVQSEGQKNWQRTVEEAGGRYWIARSVEEVMDIVDEMKRWNREGIK